MDEYKIFNSGNFVKPAEDSESMPTNIDTNKSKNYNFKLSFTQPKDNRICTSWNKILAFKQLWFQVS